MIDLHHNIKVSRALSPVADTGITNTAQVTQILDTANYFSNELVICTGNLEDADATFTVLLEEGAASNLSDNSSVADADMIGTEALASFTYASDNTTLRLGYKGTKRYIRATITPANNTGNAPMAAVWVQANPRVAPTS